MIKINKVTKKIKDSVILKDIDLEVGNGQIVGLVGPNGAGKTTLLNIISGIWSPDGGSVLIDGVDITKDAKIKNKIGYIPDVPYLYPKLTAREFLFFVGSLYGLDSQLIDKKIQELNKALELDSWLDELMESYPRGVRQKITFAAMLLHSPKVLLLDEPLTNLDPKAGKVVKELLLAMAKKGACILLSTHILEVAEKLCQQIVIIHKGQKIVQGSLSELREMAKRPDSDLEEIFLQLTGGEKYTELLKYLT